MPTENEVKKCEVCDEPLRLTWTDTHGISACVTCCSPYRSYKYNDKKEREVVCESLTLPKYVPQVRRYWQEKKRKIPHCFDMGLERDGSSYSGLTEEDVKEFNEWMKKQPTVE